MIALKTAAIVALSALAFSLPALTGAETRLTATIDGQVHEWPSIGTESYSRSCEIVQAFEDHSAIAYCAEDGAVMAYDPDGSIDHGIGWYVVN